MWGLFLSLFLIENWPCLAFLIFPNLLLESLANFSATSLALVVASSTMAGLISFNLVNKYSVERKSNETEEQFLYKTRKKAFGDFKDEIWSLPEKNLKGLRASLEERFSLIFRKLNVVNTADIVLKECA